MNFLKSNFVGFNRLFISVYANHGDNAKRFHARKYYLPKAIIDNYNVIISEKDFYDQAINSNIKRYEEIRKLTREQEKGYTIGCILDYEYIKNHYRLIAVDLSNKKNLMQMQKQFSK